MMSKLIFIITVIAWLPGYETTSTLAPGSDRATFLAGSTKKSWYLYEKKSEGVDGKCQLSQVVSADNTYTFSVDGSFEFDRGTVSEDPSCEDCCSDFVNVVGEWKLTRNQKILKVTVLHERGNKANAESIVLFDATIDQLDEEVLKFRQTDKTTGSVYLFEFRKSNF